MSSAAQSQKVVFAAGAACVLAIAFVYVLRMQTSTKKLNKKKPPPPPPSPVPQHQNAAAEENLSQFECSSSGESESDEQQENDRMQISAIAAPEASDELRLDSGIGSPKGTPSNNRSNNEQIVEQASGLIQESFSAVLAQENGIDSSSLFVETSSISITESEPKLHASFVAESSELNSPKAEEIVEKDFSETTSNSMTQNSTVDELAVATPETKEQVNDADKENDQASQKLEFTSESSPTREIRKGGAKKENSPAKEKVSSRRKAATRNKDHIPNNNNNNSNNKEQIEQVAAQSKAKNSDDRNNNNNSSSSSSNNNRRQSTGSDVVTDSKSEGSADSSKAGSDSCPATVTSVLYQYKHEFELPTELCGRLIGRLGSNVKDIRERTGAIVTVRPHPTELNLKQVYVVGKQEESVKLAMAEIRKKFPLKLYPHLTLSTIDRHGASGLAGALPPNYLTLPEDQDTVVLVTAIENLNHLYFQTPNNQTYGLFMQQEAKMVAAHGATGTEPPPLPADLIRPNAICVVEDTVNNSMWYRVAIDQVISPEEVRVKFVDYGGHENLHPSRLRQIRSDFIYTPFQSIESVIVDIEPTRPDGQWTVEALDAFRSYVASPSTILLARVVSYMGTIPCVQLTCIFRETGEQISLSHQLVADGFAKWATDSNRSSPAAAHEAESASGPSFTPADFPQLGATQKTC